MKGVQKQARFHGVMVSTQDSESCDPSSNLGGTCTNLLNHEKRCKHNFKNEAPARFELAISCLLDRRFNQLSHGARVPMYGKPVHVIKIIAIQQQKSCAQRGARTHDPEIKSLMLYRLS